MNKLLIFLLELLSMFFGSSKLGITAKNLLNQHIAEKTITQLEKKLISPPLPQKVSWTEKFEAPNEFYKIIDDKNSTILLRSKYDLETKSTYAYNIFINALNDVSFLSSISKELYFSSALIRARQSIIDIADISSEIDINLICDYLIKSHKLNKNLLNQYYSKLEKLAKYGFFNSVFLHIIFNNKTKLDKIEIDDLIEELIQWENDRINKNYVEHIVKKCKLFFISNTASIYSKTIIEFKKHLNNYNILLASIQPEACLLNFKLCGNLIDDKKIANVVNWDRYFLEKEKKWTYCFRTWIYKGNPFIPDNKFVSIDLYEKSAHHENVSFEIKQENINLLVNKFLKRRKVPKKIFIHKKGENIYLCINKLNP